MTSQTSKYYSRYKKNIDVPEIEIPPFIDKVLNRATCRNFRPDSLDPGQLEMLLASAQSSATSGGIESWSVLILSTPEAKNKLRSLKEFDSVMSGQNRPDPTMDYHNIKVFETAPVFLIWLADLSRMKLILDSTSTNLDNRLDKAELHLKAIIDATIAAQTFALLSEQIGLGVMYCGSIRHFPQEVMTKTFNLPKYCTPLFGMAIGKPQRKSIVKPRLEQKFVCHYATYNNATIDELEEYNNIFLNAEKAKYGQKAKDYFQRVNERSFVGWSSGDVGDYLKSAGFTFD